MIKKDKSAFTLSEILITLGVIGVVAAMTIPSLIQNHQKKVAAVRVKSAYSQLLQAIQLSEADNGPISDWEYYSTKAFVSKYIEPYFKGMVSCAHGTDKSCGTAPWSTGETYTLPNGTSLSFIAIASSGNFYFDVYVDINPSKAKYNKTISGRDAFYFSNDNYTKNLKPWGWVEGLTREDCLNGRLRLGGACKKGYTSGLKRDACTALLYIDGWEIKDDYPW